MSETPLPPPHGSSTGADAESDSRAGSGSRADSDSSAGTGASTGPDATAPASGFFGWLRELGTTRGSERWLAGVAGGIAIRLGVDPIIIRGIFVVFAVLGGPGILLYAAGWLLLPDTRGRIHLEEVIRGRAETWVIVVGACIAALLILPSLLGAGPLAGAWMWDIWGVPSWVPTAASVLWWIAVIGTTVWFIVWIATRSSSTARGEGTTGPSNPTDQRATFLGEEAGNRAAAWGERAGERAAAWDEQAGERAAAWGERVGQDAEAWTREHRPGAAQVLFTFALALLAGGGTWYWAAATPGALGGASGVAALTVGLLAAVGVLAVSMIIAGARGRFSGGIGFVAFLGAITLTFTSVIPQGTSFMPFGEHSFTPAQAPAGVSMIAGGVDADLTATDAHLHDGAEVWQGAGTTRISVPEGVPTVLDIGVLGGNVAVDDGRRSSRIASGVFLTRQVEFGMDGTGRIDPDDIVHLRVRLAFGSVEIDADDRAYITEPEVSR